jgi:hypothetical protein
MLVRNKAINELVFIFICDLYHTFHQGADSAGLASPWATPVAESGTDFDPLALKARRRLLFKREFFMG